MLLGPYRASEGAVAPNQVATRTAARGLPATVIGGAASVAVVLGVSLPAGPFIKTWTAFSLAWVIAFVGGALVTLFLGGRRAV